MNICVMKGLLSELRPFKCACDFSNFNNLKEFSKLWTVQITFLKVTKFFRTPRHAKFCCSYFSYETEGLDRSLRFICIVRDARSCELSQGKIKII